MAVGQNAHSPAVGGEAIWAAETRLSVRELDRGAGHVRMLRTVLELDGLYRAEGLGLSSVAQIALALGARRAAPVGC